MYGDHLFHYVSLRSCVQLGGDENQDPSVSDEKEEFLVPPEFATMYKNQNDAEYFSFFVNPYPLGSG